MARFRSLDPDFWQQPQLATLPWLTRLILIGLVSQADDHGRVPANPMHLQALLFPFGKRPTVKKVREALVQLDEAREIHLYVGTDNRDYALLRGWKNSASWQYQVIGRRYAPKHPDSRENPLENYQIDEPRRPPKTDSDKPPKKVNGRRKKVTQ